MGGNRRLNVLLLLVAFPGWRAVPGPVDGPVDEIAGTWRGTSVCVDRAAAPACNDEQVVYEIKATPGKVNTVTVNADRVVDGKRVPMGALDFAHDAKSDAWTTGFDTPRVHARWQLAVKGTRMTGNMILLPSGAVVRKVDLRKDA